MLSALALALLLSGAPTPRRPPYQWDIPEVTQDVPIDGPQVALGRAMRLRMVRSKWDAVRLIKKLEKDFRAAGLFVPPPGTVAKALPMASLAGVDGPRKLVYTVLLQPNTDGTSTLFLGVVDSKPVPEMTEIAPAFPGARDILTSNVEGLRSLSYTAVASSKEVMSFYREVLGRAGYAEAEPGQFVRAGEVMNISAEAGDAGPLLRVLVYSRSVAMEPAP